MFLRAGRTLPDGLDLVQEQFCDSWMAVKDTMSEALDVSVRGAGWHFMWTGDSYTRVGVGRTMLSAVGKATTRALKQVKREFNAAELGAINVSQYPGCQVAKITVYARHIQRQATLAPRDKLTIQQLMAL